MTVDFTPVSLNDQETAKVTDFMTRWNDKHPSRRLNFTEAVKMIFLDGLRELEDCHDDLYLYSDNPMEIEEDEIDQDNEEQ